MLAGSVLGLKLGGPIGAAIGASIAALLASIASDNEVGIVLSAGAAGAAIGFLIAGPIGAAIGLGIGLALGTIIANPDLIDPTNSPSRAGRVIGYLMAANFKECLPRNYRCCLVTYTSIPKRVYYSNR